MRTILCLTLFALTITAQEDLGVFVWFSDAHFDPFYSTENAKLHLEEAPCNLGQESPYYSAYGCGSNLVLLQSAVSRAGQAVQELGYSLPDFVLFTGDATRHSTDGLPLSIDQVVNTAFNTTYSLFQTYFADVPLIDLPAPDLGNNDLIGDYQLNVTSTQPCFPKNNGDPPTATNSFLQGMSVTFRNLFVSDMEASVFACGGYVNRFLSTSNLSIIHLNTIVWSVNHEPQSNQDAFGQHVWLTAQLQEAREKDYKVYIVGHISPILQSFTGSLGQALWQQSHATRYLETVSAYQDVIAAQLFAHVHSNELRAMDSLPESASPMLIKGSLSPCYTTNPAFSIVFFNRDTKQPIDLVTYQLNLSIHNETIASMSDQPVNEDPWVRLFDNLTSFLGMSALTNSETKSLSKRLMTDSTTFNAYFNQWYMGTYQKCDACQVPEACLVACGFVNTSWEACVDGGTADACNSNGPTSAALRVTGFRVAVWFMAVAGIVRSLFYC